MRDTCHSRPGCKPGSRQTSYTLTSQPFCTLPSRAGRLVMRAAMLHPGVEIVAVNDPFVDAGACLARA